MTDRSESWALPFDRLKKIAEEIPSGVRPADVETVLASKVLNPAVITEGLQNTIATNLKEDLNKFWVEHEVGERLREVGGLKQLKRACPQKENRALEARYLRQLKQALEGKVGKLQGENLELENQLKGEANKINEQLKDITFYSNKIIL